MIEILIALLIIAFGCFFYSLFILIRMQAILKRITKSIHAIEKMLPKETTDETDA